MAAARLMMFIGIVLHPTPENGLLLKQRHSTNSQLGVNSRPERQTCLLAVVGTAVWGGASPPQASASKLMKMVWDGLMTVIPVSPRQYGWPATQERSTQFQ